MTPSASSRSQLFPALSSPSEGINYLLNPGELPFETPHIVPGSAQKYRRPGAGPAGGGGVK